MKKGVVLLITLFFITAISVIVLKNLDDTDKFLEKQNYILNNTQVLISVKNIKNEVAKLLNENKDDIDDALKDGAITLPINIQDLSITSILEKYVKIDINEMKNKDSKVVEDFFISNDIFDYALFKSIYNEKIEELIEDNKKVNNSKQLDDIINTFIMKSQKKDILNIKNSLGFLNPDNLYELNIEINFNNAKAQAYYILKNDGKVQYFDISFK